MIKNWQMCSVVSLFPAVRLWVRWARREGGSGKGHIRSGVRGTRPQQPGPTGHQGNPRERQQVREKRFVSCYHRRRQLWWTAADYRNVSVSREIWVGCSQLNKFNDSPKGQRFIELVCTYLCEHYMVSLYSSCTVNTSKLQDRAQT